MTPFSAPYRYEARAWRTGVTLVAGVDEAGRGPLAGPVVAAAVVIASDRRIKGVADSKLLLPAERERLFQLIQERAVSVGVGVVDHETIDRINILQATRRAMAEALARLAVMPELIITDFVNLPALPCPQRNLVAGDRRCASVAAASIVAKVTRDRIMLEADRDFPAYGFARHRATRRPSTSPRSTATGRARSTGARSPGCGVRASCSCWRRTTDRRVCAAGEHEPIRNPRGAGEETLVTLKRLGARTARRTGRR